MSLAFKASGGELITSDLCSIDGASIGTNEGTFTPRNFLNVSSWTDGTDESVSDNTKYRFYGYYPTSNSAATYDAGRGGVLLSIPSAQTGEFGRHQICSSAAVEMSKSEIVKNKMVRFSFAPVTTLLRIRFKFTATNQDGQALDYLSEVYLKQLILTMSDDTAIAGDCRLKFADQTLTAVAEKSSNQIVVNLTQPVRITKEYLDDNYVDIVLLPTTSSARLDFSAGLQNGKGEFTVASKDSPAGGFKSGVRYFLDRELKIVIQEDTMPDASYTDGGQMWDSQVVNDGAYTDAGNVW